MGLYQRLKINLYVYREFQKWLDEDRTQKLLSHEPVSTVNHEQSNDLLKHKTEKEEVKQMNTRQWWSASEKETIAEQYHRFVNKEITEDELRQQFKGRTIGSIHIAAQRYGNGNHSNVRHVTAWTDEEKLSVCKDYASYKNGDISEDALKNKYKNRSLSAIRLMTHDVQKVMVKNKVPKHLRRIYQRILLKGISKKVAMEIVNGNSFRLRNSHVKKICKFLKSSSVLVDVRNGHISINPVKDQSVDAYVK